MSAVIPLFFWKAILDFNFSSFSYQKPCYFAFSEFLTFLLPKSTKEPDNCNLLICGFLGIRIMLTYLSG